MRKIKAGHYTATKTYRLDGVHRTIDVELTRFVGGWDLIAHFLKPDPERCGYSIEGDQAFHTLTRTKREAMTKLEEYLR